MNGRGDYPEEMRNLALDDTGIEALLRGQSPGADPELAGVAAFVRDMRATAAGPAPAPSAALATLLRDGAERPGGRTAPAPLPPGRSGSARSGWRRRLAVIGVSLGVAVTGTVGAGAAGLLPDAVERVVGGVVEALTPLELPAGRLDVDRDPPRPGHGPASDLGRPGAEQPAPSDRQPVTGELGPAPGGLGSSSPSGPAPATPSGAGTPATSAPSGGAGPGVTTPAGGGAGPGLAPPPTVPVSPLPTTPTTLPGMPPAPTVPDLGGPLPVAPPGATTTVPRLNR